MASSPLHVALVAGSHDLDIAHEGPSDSGSNVPDAVIAYWFSAESAVRPSAFLVIGLKSSATVLAF